MNATKVALRLAKANLAAAKRRGDAAACRTYMEELADLKGRGSAPKPPKPALTKAATFGSRPDAELEQVRFLKRLLSEPDGESRKAALAKLERMLSPDELADVLTARSPAQIVKVAGPSPRDTAATDSVGWMIGRLADRSLPTDERNRIIDRLIKAAAGDRRATDALAQIVLGVR